MDSRSVSLYKRALLCYNRAEIPIDAQDRLLRKIRKESNIMAFMYDYHLHTHDSDGKHSPAEVAEQADRNGMKILGFSDHSYLPFEEFSLPLEKQAIYREEIAALKERYRGRMTILCGIEKDYYSPIEESEFDYAVGSVHYLLCGNEYRPIDLSPASTEETIQIYFGGDPYAYAEAYYRMIADLFTRVKADIIGHLDLLMKFHEKKPRWETEHPRYRHAWKEAIEALLPQEKPFEINSGAISRGWRESPYPAPEMLRYIKARGGRIILSSDSHAKQTLCYQFEKERALAMACGFTSQCILTEDGLKEIAL